MVQVPNRVILLLLTCVIITGQAIPPPGTEGEDSHNYDFMAPFSWCQSTHPPRPYDGPAPSIPRLPKQYSMKVEANILEKDWTTELEEHYDRPNQRASVALTFNGTTTRTIFNFKAGEKYDIYDNGTCGTRPGQISFFGYISKHKDKNGRPAMATVNEMLRMTSGFNLTYVGQTAVRGIKANHWTSCQQWEEVGARFQLDYYFTHPDYQPATGQVDTQLPIRIVINGTAGNINMKNKPMKGRHNFYHFYDFLSIRVGPPRDLTVFQIPPGVVCKGRSDHKTMPDMPDIFQMSTEMTVPDCPMPPFHQTILYDYEHKLVETRREMKVPKGFGKRPKGSQGPAMGNIDLDDFVDVEVNVVEDYSTGLRYLVSQNNKCTIEQMPGSGDDATPVMSHGEALLKMADGQQAGSMDFTYQGLSTFRNLKVEVWGSEQNGITQQVFFLAGPDGKRKPPGEKKQNDDDNEGKRKPKKGGKQNNDDNEGKQKPKKGDKQNNDDQEENDGQGGWTGPKQNSWPPKPNSSNGTGSDYPKKKYDHSPHESSDAAETQSSQKQTVLKPKIPKRPIMIGLLFRNKTAVDQRDMSGLFTKIMTENAKQWLTMAQDVADDESGQRNDRSPDMSDQISWGMAMERTVGNHYGEAMINVYNFKPTHPDVGHFQVSSCYDDEQTSKVMLMVQTSFRKTVLGNKISFINSLRRSVAEAAGVSILAVNNVRVMPLKIKASNLDATVVTFTLLGSTRVQGAGLPTISIREAKARLNRAIANGIGFKVDYQTHTKSFMVDQGEYTFDYSRVDLLTKSRQPDLRNGVDTSSQAITGRKSDDGHYSDGAVAGIAVGTMVLGGIIALVVAAIIYKRRYPQLPLTSLKNDI